MKCERWGSPLVLEKYRGEKACDRRHTYRIIIIIFNDNNNNSSNNNNNLQSVGPWWPVPLCKTKLSNMWNAVVGGFQVSISDATCLYVSSRMSLTMTPPPPPLPLYRLQEPTQLMHVQTNQSGSLLCRKMCGSSESSVMICYIVVDWREDFLSTRETLFY